MILLLLAFEGQYSEESLYRQSLNSSMLICI